MIRPKPFCEFNSDCEPWPPLRGRRLPNSRAPMSAECLRFDVQFNVCKDDFCVTTNEATSDCATSADCDTGDDCIDGICR